MAFFLTQNIAQNIGNAIMTSQHITPATKKNGKQLLYRPSDIQCDWAERVECDDRQVCDDNWENCHSNHIATAKPSICEGIPCDHGDGFYPEGDCAQCFCRCVGGAHYETCCAPGLAFNPAVEQCDWPANINGCQ